MKLVISVDYRGELFVYELPLPEWWYVPASSKYLHHLAMGLLYEHDWCDNEIDYSWELVNDAGVLDFYEGRKY